MSEHSPSFGRVSVDTTDSAPSLTSTSLPADSRRRYALQYLTRFEYPVELRTLATHVAAAVTTAPVGTVSDDERERIAIRLHHIDIPKLVADEAVAYDPESRMVVSTGVTDGVNRYTDASDRSRHSDAV